MAHARLSPSNHRWVHCPGSVREEAQYPDVSGEAAIDGTGTHLLVELCIENSEMAEDYLGRIIGVNDPDKPEGWLVCEERAKRAQMCLDYIDRRFKELEAEFPNAHIKVEAESKADPGGFFGRTDWHGTADVTISVFEEGVPGLRFLEVVDYKDGRGYVSEKDNSQLLSYLGGKMRPYVGSGPELVRPFKTEKIGACRMTIVQPKTNPAVRYQDCTSQYAMDKLIELEEAAYATDDEDAPLTPGKHCQWCKANPERGGHCTAATEQSLETVKNMSTELVMKDGQSLFEYIGQMVADPKSLTVEQLAELADARDPLVSAFDKVMEEIQNRIEQDIEVPRYAMVPGKRSYVWGASEEEMAKVFKGRRMKQDDYAPRKILSVAQMRKSDILTDDQKKRIEKDYVVEKAGKLSLKRVGDNYQAKVEKDVTMMFGDVQQETPAEESAPVSFF